MILDDLSLFRNEIFVAQLSQPAVREKLEDFIEKYEPIICDELIGSDEYQAILNDPQSPERAKLKPIIAHYTYYWYTRDGITASSGSGKKKPATENADPATEDQDMVFAWNWMLDLIRLNGYRSENLKPINSLDL